MCEWNEKATIVVVIVGAVSGRVVQMPFKQFSYGWLTGFTMYRNHGRWRSPLLLWCVPVLVAVVGVLVIISMLVLAPARWPHSVGAGRSRIGSSSGIPVRRFLPLIQPNSNPTKRTKPTTQHPLQIRHWRRARTLPPTTSAT